MEHTRNYNTFNHQMRKYAVLLCFVIVPFTAHAQTEAESLPSDVRLVIDVSGSMKQNDPNNLRQPAVELLVRLLPETSKAGVWTFGRWVNMLTKHQVVDEIWRENAKLDAQKINSVGLYTNIGEALEKAAYDVDRSNNKYRTSILLLTDGMVDIDKDPAVNQKEWRRIVDEVLPKLKSAGVIVHTIALSDNADTDLLNKLSLNTDGIAAVAHTAEDLMQIFLKAFDAAAPMEQVPLSDDGFVIDSSVEEFTALIFRGAESKPTQIVGPDQEVITASTASKYVNWYKTKSYDLITVKQPLEGQWNVIADMDPGSRVTVVSNLNLRVRPLPNNVFEKQQESVSFALQEDGSIITRSEFLTIMDISASMMAGKDEFDLREIWKQKIETKVPPEDGMFNVDLPAFTKAGIYQLSVVVDGKSFVREFNHQFTTRQPFGADISQIFNDGKLEYLLTARYYGGDVNIKKTKIVATIVAPDERNKIRPLNATETDTWQTSIRPELEGEYTAKIKIRGETLQGQGFEVNLEEIRFSYSIDKGFVEKEEPFFDGGPTPTPEKEKTQEPSPEPTAEAENTESDENLEVENSDKDLAAWIIYAALGLGNVLLFGIGFVVVRKVLGINKNDVLEQFSEENIEKEIQQEREVEEPTPSTVEEVEEVEEEPPMEDIDPDFGESEIPMEVDPEPDAEPDPESIANIDAFPDMDSAGGAEIDKAETAAEVLFDETEAPVEDDPMDALDDLEQMAVESEEAAEEPKQEPVTEDEEEEDMVAAMLKAQGLDLAEDELDDAISSLIDELENDDSLGAEEDEETKGLDK